MKLSYLGLRRWLWIRSKFRVTQLVYALGGIGDELMLTAVARAARQAGKPITVLTHRPEIWHGNRDVAGLETNSDWWFYAQRRRWSKARVIHVACKAGIHRHLAQQMADHLGLTLAEGWRPVFHHQAPARVPTRLAVQNSCRGATWAATTKEWPQDRWTELVRRLAPDFELVQIGTESDPPLAPALDLRGKTTLKEAAAILASAACFVGLESGLMHLAAATQTRSVIIYGGRTRPHETGYPWNANLCRDPGCAGCGLNSGCSNDLKCLEIPVAEVETVVRLQAGTGLRSSGLTVGGGGHPH